MHRLREELAIDGERTTGRNPGHIRAGEQQASQRTQLRLKQAVCVGELDRFEGVTADQLCKTIGLVRGGLDEGPHLVERDGHAPFRQSPGGFRAGETAADDGGVHARATSSGSATTRRCPHLRQVRLSPSALLIFFSMPSQPQLGHVSGTGRFQVEKSHAG